MKKYLYLLFAAFLAVGMSACSPDDNEPDGPQTEVPENPGDPDNGNEPGTPDNPGGGNGPGTPDNPNPDPAGKTLIVYYSFTNNVHTIVNDLKTQIDADAVRVEPAEEGLDYAADNYALGSALIQAIRNNPSDGHPIPQSSP